MSIFRACSPVRIGHSAQKTAYVLNAALFVILILCTEYANWM